VRWKYLKTHGEVSLHQTTDTAPVASISEIADGFEVFFSARDEMFS
jgi:hypothetical protein